MSAEPKSKPLRCRLGVHRRARSQPTGFFIFPWCTLCDKKFPGYQG